MNGEADFFWDYCYVFNRLFAYYEAPDVDTWLHAPHPQLNGERPIDLMRLGRTKEVVAILDRLDEAAYL